jgi:multisubunit Na+/H+ antiporter MnhG subunit
VPIALVLGTVALFVARLGVERYATHLRRRAAKSRKTTK